MSQNLLQIRLEKMAEDIILNCRVACNFAKSSQEKVKAMQDAKAEITALKELYGVVFAPMNASTMEQPAEEYVSAEEFAHNVLLQLKV